MPMASYGWYELHDMLAVPAIEVSSPDQLVTSPAVSVLVMTRNHDQFVEQAVRSLLAQEAPFPFEILIGEDLSTDRTLDLCRSLQRQHPATIRLLHADRNVGITANFLRLLARARGKYCALLEGDDYWTRRDKLDVQFQLLEAHPEWAWCGSRTENRRLPVAPRPEYGLRDHSRRYIFHTSTLFFRRDALSRYPRFPDMIGWDSLLSVHLAQHGNSGFVDAETSYYRRHAGGLWWGRSRADQFGLTIQATEAMERHLGPGSTRDITAREFWIFRSLLQVDARDGVLTSVRENLSLLRRWATYLWRRSRSRTVAVLAAILLQPLTLAPARARFVMGLGSRLRRLTTKPDALA